MEGKRETKRVKLLSFVLRKISKKLQPSNLMYLLTEDNDRLDDIERRTHGTIIVGNHYKCRVFTPKFYAILHHPIVTPFLAPPTGIQQMQLED
ncbi:hypothetical protein KXD40_009300 [Peronospora effusa]|nr:hypothetical protein KXD40_009300 [Peronospora effusa]